jgi:ubiquinone/menaquinone biosynthesis C-methylase UbiE
MQEMPIKEKPFALLEAKLLVSFVRRVTIDPRKTLAPHIRKGMKVLDYGCGMGFFSLPAAELAGMSGKVVCVDINEKMLEALGKRASSAGLASIIETRLFRGENVLRPDESLDFAFSIAVVHELPEAGKTTGAIFNSLKPGGRFLLAEPKGHVSRKVFLSEVALCESCGFRLVGLPAVSIHNAALLEKPS